MLEQIALKILAIYSLLIGNTPQLNNTDWTIIKNWQLENGQFVFEADGSKIIEKCKKSLSSYIKFPLIISSMQKVIVDNIIIYPHIAYKSGSVIGHYDTPIISCYQICNAKSINWTVYSFSKVFSNSLFLPEIVNYKPLQSILSEIFHQISAAILFFITLFALIVFRGKIPNRFLLGFILTSFMWANYSIMNGSWLWISEIPVPLVHKYLSTCLLVGMIFLFYTLFQYGLSHKLLLYFLIFSSGFGVIFTVFGFNLDIIFSGANLNHAMFFICIIDSLILAFIRFIKNMMIGNFILLVGLLIFAVMLINDILMINGTIKSVLMAPLGVSILFITLGVIIHRQIQEVYSQRDDFEIRLEKLYQEKLEIIQKNAVAHAVSNTVQMIAHDLKTPFNMVKFVLHQLRTNNLQHEIIVRLSDSVDNNIRYVDNLLSDLLAGGNNVNKLEPIDLKILVKEIWQKLCLESIKPYNLVEEYIHTNQLFVDGLKVKRLFTNLLSNAIEAMGDRANRIWVKTCHKTVNDREFVEIIVGNEGSFISEENIEKIFSKFHTFNKKTGSGLGLAICCEIVKSHGGEISCRSDKLIGTEFIFTLPAVTL